MSLKDVLTQRRWKLQDSLWLLSGIFVERPKGEDLYSRAPQVNQEAIDNYALGVFEPLDKARSFIDIRSALQGYTDSTFLDLKKNINIVWPEFDVDYNVKFLETHFAKSELFLISQEVEELGKRFETTADQKYCEIPYQTDEGLSIQFSPESQWNKEYMIEWASSERNLNLSWLTDKISEAKNSAVGVGSKPPATKKFDVKKLVNKIEEFHMWVYNKLVSLSNQGEPKPTMSEMLVYIKKDCKDYVKTHGQTIHYWSTDADNDANWSKNGLKMFIQRHTLEPNKKQDP
jgi:hypothetical protein